MRLQIPPQRADSFNSLEALRASLLAAQPAVRRSMSSAALDLLSEPPLKTVPLAPAAPPHRALRWVRERTGVALEPRHLALGLQMVVAYTTVLVLIVVPASNDAFRNSLHWALFVVVAVLEPSTGAALAAPLTACVLGCSWLPLRRVPSARPALGNLAHTAHSPSPSCQAPPSSRACSAWLAPCWQVPWASPFNI